MEIRDVYRDIGPPEHLVHTQRVVTLKSRPSLAETCSRPPKSCATHSRKSSCREGEQLTRGRRGRRLATTLEKQRTRSLGLQKAICGRLPGRIR